MNTMKPSSVVLLLALTGAPALAANFSGKWAIQPQSGRGGRGGPTILVLNQVGSEVTGNIGARTDAGTGSPVNTEVIDGKVEGNTISFYVWTGTDQPVRATYHGTMSATGDEIAFTVEGGRSGGFGGTGGGQGRGAANVSTPAQSGVTANAERAQAAGPQQMIARRAK